MLCPVCQEHANSEVLTVRHRADGSIRRRHTCSHCQVRWTTNEDLVPGSITVAAPPPRRRPQAA